MHHITSGIAPGSVQSFKRILKKKDLVTKQIIMDRCGVKGLWELRAWPVAKTEYNCFTPNWDIWTLTYPCIGEEHRRVGWKKTGGKGTNYGLAQQCLVQWTLKRQLMANNQDIYKDTIEMYRGNNNNEARRSLNVLLKIKGRMRNKISNYLILWGV